MVGRDTPIVYRDEHVRSAPKAMEIKSFCASRYGAKSPTCRYRQVDVKGNGTVAGLLFDLLDTVEEPGRLSTIGGTGKMPHFLNLRRHAIFDQHPFE